MRFAYAAAIKDDRVNMLKINFMSITFIITFQGPHECTFEGRDDA